MTKIKIFPRPMRTPIKVPSTPAVESGVKTGCKPSEQVVDVNKLNKLTKTASKIINESNSLPLMFAPTPCV
jgi:hypothetical protein